MTVELNELDFQKNNHYRDHYRMALGGTIFMAVLSVALSIILVMMTMINKQPQYIASTTTGVHYTLNSLSEPVLTKPYLLQWASKVGLSAYNLDFLNHNAEINNMAPYFSADAFSKYKAALKDSGLIDAIESKKLNLSAVVSGDPVIVHEFILHGRHTWVVQLPIKIMFTSASENKNVTRLITMQIQRVPVLSTSQGIQVTDFVIGGVQ